MENVPPPGMLQDKEQRRSIWGPEADPPLSIRMEREVRVGDGLGKAAAGCTGSGGA